MKLVAEGPERLDKFLARSLPGHTRSRLQRLISEGLVTVQGETASKAGLELREGWTVELGDVPETPPHDLEPVAMPLDVVYEDDDLLILNKPRGLMTHPAPSSKSPSLVNALLARSHSLSQGSAPYRPGIVHRLDKDTTGLMVVAKTDAAHAGLARQIADRTAVRVYLAVVRGDPLEDRFTIEANLGRHPTRPLLMAVRTQGKRAVTHVRVLKRTGESSLVACKLDTGRTHQIRVHLASCHMPVFGDALYSSKDMPTGPLQLHAVLLSVTQPTTGKRITVTCAPPAEFMIPAEFNEEVLLNWT
ncbi:MAG: RluA family pseudouridine synthase [Armatimonadetes bacterium]|nr:RluA family pseudouridine synthase [Armatimonadota bacterium]